MIISASSFLIDVRESCICSSKETRVLIFEFLNSWKDLFDFSILSKTSKVSLREILSIIEPLYLLITFKIFMSLTVT